MPNLIAVIVTDMQVCHEVIRVWEEAGVPGATILDSMGMRHLQKRHAHRDDLPLMPSLRSMLEQEEYNHRTVFSVVPDNFDVEELIRRTEALVVARDYLRRFPRGTYANAARALVRSSIAEQ